MTPKAVPAPFIGSSRSRNQTNFVGEVRDLAPRPRASATILGLAELLWRDGFHAVLGRGGTRLSNKNYLQILGKAGGEEIQPADFAGGVNFG
jgi:hypothetical protein